MKDHPNIQLVISKGTNDSLKLNYEKTTFVSHAQKFKENGFEILAVEKDHDGLEPLSFIIKEDETQKSIAFFTDLGEFTPLHSNLIKQCNIVFLECNYDDELVKTSNMHYTYLQRLQSPLGHLSNNQAQELCKQFICDNQTIILSHISENVNTYELAYSKIKQVIDEQQTKNNQIIVSFQKESTGWIE